MRCFFAVLATLIISIIPAFADQNKRVTIVASYEQSHVCGLPQQEGIVSAIENKGWYNGQNLTIQYFYMDTKRKNTSIESMKNVASQALSDIKEFKPDVVITIDDNAFREVGLPLIKSSKTPVVFSGMNVQPEQYNNITPFMTNRSKPEGQTTGIYEKLYLSRSVRVLKSIGSIKGDTVLAITDTSPTGKALTIQIDEELQELPTGLKGEIIVAHSWEEYKSIIKKYNKNKHIFAYYPVALRLIDKQGTVYTAPEIFKWTKEHSTKPEMALNYAFANLGLLGGAAVDFKAMGLQAGAKAGDILNGANPGSLSIDDASDYAIVFNRTRAAELKLVIPHELLTAADHIYY
ncbi:MAG: ABC transporter substrate-binding protein [Desulfovibrio sp.]